MKAVAIRKVNQRLEANTGAQKLNPVEVGESINVIGIEEGELYRGSKRWLIKDDGTKTWAEAYNVNYGSDYIKQFGIESLWNLSTGKGVKVGVIDNEINVDHISLKDSTITKHKTNSVDSIHGTYMAAIIGARNVKDGFVGMAPSCELHGSSYAKENSITPKEVLEALKSLGDADIINLSFAIKNSAFLPSTGPIGKEIDQLINKYVASGKIIVSAAGNESRRSQGKLFIFPAAYIGTISVSGGYKISDNYFIKERSNIWNGVDLIGPTDNFFNIIPQSVAIFQQRTEGNSVTAALVSGLLALVYGKLSAKGLLSKKQILDLISIPVSAMSKEGNFSITTNWLCESKIKKLINL